MRNKLGPNKLAQPKAPFVITAIGVFLFFGATMASLAGATLTWSGTFLDGIWILNPTGYKQLSTLGKPVGILFLFLGIALGVAGAGWFMRRRWGWRLAMAIIATQVLGDLLNILRGDFWRGSVGFSIALALLLYLLRPAVRAVFSLVTLP